MHAKFIKLGMRAPHVISNDLTKWYIQIILCLSIVPFLSYAMFEF
jgi:hypothetical protein